MAEQSLRNEGLALDSTSCLHRRSRPTNSSWTSSSQFRHSRHPDKRALRVPNDPVIERIVIPMAPRSLPALTLVLRVIEVENSQDMEECCLHGDISDSLARAGPWTLHKRGESRIQPWVVGSFEPPLGPVLLWLSVYLRITMKSIGRRSNTHPLGYQHPVDDYSPCPGLPGDAACLWRTEAHSLVNTSAEIFQRGYFGFIEALLCQVECPDFRCHRFLCVCVLQQVVHRRRDGKPYGVASSSDQKRALR